MSIEQQDNNASLESRIQVLCREEKEKERKVNIVLGVMAVFLTLSMTFLSRTFIHIVSVETAFDIAYVNVVKNLDRMNQDLKRSAPHVTTAWSQRFSSTFPTIYREEMSKRIRPQIDRVMNHISASLDQTIDKALAAHQKNQHIYLSRNVHHNDILFDQVSKDLIHQINSFYANTISALRSLKKDIVYLKDNKALTAKEAKMKQAIGAWLALLEHKGAAW